MLSCRGSLRGPAGTGKDFIALLPTDGPVIGGASSKTLADEKVVKRGQSDQGCQRRTDLHAGARRRIEHPGGYLDDPPRLYLDRGDRVAGTVFDAFKAYPPPEQRMPAIMVDAIPPDMGRMNARSPWAGKTTSSWARPAAARPPPSPTH